jgi:serine/threonine-protein phosphatase 4 regulatory subunit 1
LVSIFDAEIVFKIIVPITLKLCNDVVAQVRYLINRVVRKKAAKQVYSLILCFNKHHDEMTDIYRHCVVENAKAFALSGRFN